MSKDNDTRPTLKQKIWRIIFEADTPAGKGFDVILIWLIALSVLAVALETVDSIGVKYGRWLYLAEGIFTALFTIEYFVRIWCVRKKSRYIFSFFGIVDFLSIIPFYIGLLLSGGGHHLVTVRVLRMLRVFRILKMARHMGEANLLLRALKASRAKITVFLFFVISITVIIGTIIYLIEPQEAGFSSIPQSIYWAIVTLTTVGYGDIAPITPYGKFLAAAIMIIGYAILAVPSGIFFAEIVQESRQPGRPAVGAEPTPDEGDTAPGQVPETPIVQPFCCAECGSTGHRPTAYHCFSCGAQLRDDPQAQLPIWSHSKTREETGDEATEEG